MVNQEDSTSKLLLSNTFLSNIFIYALLSQDVGVGGAPAPRIIQPPLLVSN